MAKSQSKVYDFGGWQREIGDFQCFPGVPEQEEGKGALVFLAPRPPYAKSVMLVDKSVLL